MPVSLDSQVEAFLHELSDRGLPPLYRLSLEEARETYRELTVSDEFVDAVGSVTDRTVPGPAGEIPIRIYAPSGDGPFPPLVFYHGGGWILGDLETHDGLCRALTNATDCVVVAVDYRLAPEHRFPAALEDCYAATRWVANNRTAIDATTEGFATCGESAGGTLAAGVALLARDRDGPVIDHQTLLYPPTNYAFDTDSYEENAQGYFLTREDMKRFWRGYLRSELDGRHPYASPLRADLEGMPSSLVVTAGFDPVRDDGRAFADRLADAGVSARHLEYDEMIHGFLPMLDDPELDRAREAIDEVGAAVRGAIR
ncbi:alpha/beta hydrolase [Haloterrigena sp. SYSU A121-1]|uniref:Alpha/beta hydrolase n=1 Tax=Haloterrigena gelatinilytica TaxID=2741724 RepID=A0A8J8KG55_9EURY|nr:alpha/beta hydrolase [Haloterrigena gelatinilytica]NUB91707.1 alpha/beta hydrolase [Haloterrigena gelatinilytica]